MKLPINQWSFEQYGSVTVVRQKDLQPSNCYNYYQQHHCHVLKVHPYQQNSRGMSSTDKAYWWQWSRLLQWGRIRETTGFSDDDDVDDESDEDDDDSYRYAADEDDEDDDFDADDADDDSDDGDNEEKVSAFSFFSSRISESKWN